MKTFLNVLSEEDRCSFLNVFSGETITLSKWISIMKSLKLTKNYSLYRPAYWGENSKNTKVDLDVELDHRVKLINIVGIYDIVPDDNCTGILTNLYTFNIVNNRKNVNILIKNNCMQIENRIKKAQYDKLKFDFDICLN